MSTAEFFEYLSDSTCTRALAEELFEVWVDRPESVPAPLPTDRPPR